MTEPFDEDRYDDPRNAIARAKGLEAPYIKGGEDPAPAAAIETDRKYGRLLVFMVISIVAAGFLIGTFLALIGPTTVR
jgi:hypothetical protein